ncbi:hypothetical protein RUM44_004181 [Polyplax serrata]|uniref:WD repeat and FYVE domain-containing protein 3 n=1 Tax=Polyplax serrata TaxID=468196 RepID=A0ABR1B238_POLSC
MNIMKKLRGSYSGDTGEEAVPNPQHTALGLSHLKKLFSEYLHPQVPLTKQELDDKLYNMLPLFCKVFGSCPSTDMTEKFKDIFSFCQVVSQLMVLEIRKRASNQSTEEASTAIVKFLEIENSEESSNGWMLLSTINLLASGDDSLVQVMTSISVPSTLVKCLYLFFDLPAMEDRDADEDNNPHCEFTPKERRILLQKIFVQVLVRLCSHPGPAHELSRKDDLPLLFLAITSSCPPCNKMWRKSAAEVLMTLSRHGLTQPVVSYIHNKCCMAACIENMQRAQDLSPLEIIEIFVSIFCVLKDSSEVAQTLLEDFRIEQDTSGEAQDAVRNLVLMISSLTMCGYNELKPSQASTGSLFKMSGFSLPQPSGRGVSVRNIQAFQVLQSVFLKSTSSSLCSVILDAISSVYNADNANYFILEDQHTLPQFAEKIHSKTEEIQEKFFQLLEFVVVQLNFVPCKELISLSILLRGQESVPCSIVCMRTLLNILRYNVIFKDVYREVGLLEVFVTCLKRYAALLKEKQQTEEEGKDFKIPKSNEKLGFLVIETLTHLLSGNSTNASLFRECGGARCAHNLVPYLECRHQVLGIIRELVLTCGGDDDMGTLLGMMHSAPASQILFKYHILQSLLNCLRESHRTRTVFRKVGGFVYVMSVLVSMEGCLSDNPQSPWDTIPREEIFALLHMVFNSITVAMRFEPANAKFFHQEICIQSLCDTIKLLGCFSSETELLENTEFILAKEELSFLTLFTGNVINPTIPENIPLRLSYQCLVLRLLYDVALDSYDRNGNHITNFIYKSPSHNSKRNSSQTKSIETSGCVRRIQSSSHNLQTVIEPVIVHSDIVVAILHLIPCIYCSECPQMSLSLQMFAAELLKSLVRAERNQQLMCESGLPGDLLKCCRIALEEETHPLHPPLQYILERLAAQAIEPRDLREFLRLGDPLSCVSLNDVETVIKSRPAHRIPGGPVPLTRIKTLVSMTTPRDFSPTGQNYAISPAFVELDMSAEGFGCLYLPSIAPQSPAGPGVVTGALLSVDNNVIGGIGSGDRIFPPQTGLSYSTWICIDKFSDPKVDPHGVRLLTLVRNLQGRDEHFVCLTVIVSARDKSIIVSTQETLMPQTEWEPELLGEGSARIRCPDLFQEGQWHHLALVLNKAVLKNSSFSIYLDGHHINTIKLHYISQNPGGGAATLTLASSVYAFIGTPPCWRRYSRLTWKQGPCHLIEEAISAQTVSTIYKLGPKYTGSFQAPQLNGSDLLAPLISEEKLIFGLNARAISYLTLAKIRKVYSRADNKSIARQLGMSSHENATPIRVLHNSCGHLAGPARSLGGVVVAYLGIRVFSPRPVAKMVDNIGGCAVLLGMIAMAQDVESLYAAVKALVCVARANKNIQLEMDRKRAHQTLAMLLKKKRHLLNSHILHLAFSLVGTVDSGRESSSIPNVVAFQDLLCDLEVWHEAPGDLQKSLLEHIYELVTESSVKKLNLKIARDLKLVPRLLFILEDVTSGTTRQVMLSLLGALLAQPRDSDLLWFGQFLVSTLPTTCSGFTEKDLDLKEANEQQASLVNNIGLRNRCLQLLHSLLFGARNSINVAFCEELSRILGLDWILLFLQSHLHSTTVVWSLRILIVVTSVPSLVVKFREGTENGGWLKESEMVVQSKLGVTLGYQLGASTSSPKLLHSRPEVLSVPGFQSLSWLLPKHIDVPEVYFLLVALMMGQPVKLLPVDSKLDLDSVWNFLFGTSAKDGIPLLASKIQLCPEAVITILVMVRTMLNQEIKSPESLPEWLKEYPVTIIQFIFFLYHNLKDLMPAFMSGDVLNALASTLFPRNCTDSKSSTPEYSPEDAVLVSNDFQDIGLTSHPAKKLVLDFLRVIVVDSLSLPLVVNNKTPPVVDLVLEASPDGCSIQQQTSFQTEILSTLMDHLLAADVLIGEHAALPIVSGGSSSNISNNVCYLTSRVVDKLWQGTLSKDPHEIFDFIIKLISQAKRRSTNTPLEGLYHCLNRTVLFLLSRTTNSIAQQTSILEALHKLTTHRVLIFGVGNHELEFIGCLTYCLIQLNSDMKIVLDTNMKTMWHVNPEENLTAQQAQNLMSIAASRVWEELYIHKKPAIEEVFKVPLNTMNNKVPDLLTVREQVVESATKLWLNYIDMERKSLHRIPWELQNQIQSKIQKVTGGLTRLASRTKVKKEETRKIRRMQIAFSEVFDWVQNQTALVKELVDVRLRSHHLAQEHMQKYMLEEWGLMQTELTRERGLWGPVLPNRLDKWMLDMTEGPCRMRKKMMRNELFYLHYPYRPLLDGTDNKALKYKVAMSSDSKEYYFKKKLAHNWFDSERDVILDSQDVTPSVLDDPKESNDFQGMQLNRTVSDSDDNTEDIEGESGNIEETPQPDNQTLIRLLEDHEKISHMFRCARVQGLDTTEGLLLFGKEHLYVIDGFTLLKSREIRDIESVPDGNYEPILPSTGSPRRSRAMRQCSKFSYDDIREVHKRRYLLQPMALEVFSGDGRNYLLAFPRKLRNKVYHRFLAFATGIADSAQQSVAGQKRTANVEQATGILSSLIGETSVTQRWVRGEISNFQYLMHLNTLAGRSYNDLMQYPVFPWILADYDSEELDLTHPSSFRDFSKPMGAQTCDRLSQFKKRYKEWDDPHGETPPYHYGTHYSSAMIVCSYLVRMEPFTQHFLRLQGGHFDLADRMFHSIKEAWLSAAKHNMADVKELIPEFFYLPEFLCNENNFDLGSKQNGVELGDVVLPPWAKNDPREFIRVHRQALECDFVSQHLHEWIDLIFGHKQSGPAAVEAVNVFHHLFYEGNVDIYNIDDPLKKTATIGFINNFGQIPKQLFKKPHPAKKLGGGRSFVLDPTGLTGFTQQDKFFFHHLDNLRPSLQPVKELKGPVGQILTVEKSMLAVEQNKVLMPPSYGKYVAWGFADHSLRIGSYDSEKVSLVCEEPFGEIVCCTCPSNRLIVTAGTSTVVTICELNKKTLSIKQCLYGHSDAVTCLTSSPAYNVIISGSRDQTAIVWDLSRMIFVRQLTGHSAPLAAVAVNDLTGDIATCAGTWLHLWSINGDELACVNTCVARADRMQQILCVAFSTANEWDPQNVVITGSSDGVVRMWSLDYVQVPTDEKPSTPKKESETLERKEDVQVDKNATTADTESDSDKCRKRVQTLVHQMSISTDLTGTEECLPKSGSESSLSEDDKDNNKESTVKADQGRDDNEGLKDTDKKIDEPSSLRTPGTHHKRLNYENKSKSEDIEGSMLGEPKYNVWRRPSCKVDLLRKEFAFDETESIEKAESVGSTPIEVPTPIVRRRRSSAARNPEFRKSEGCSPSSEQNRNEEKPTNFEESVVNAEETNKMRSSKSDTSLTDSFVVVDNNGVSDTKDRSNPQNLLREGFRWQRQLLFKAKLTMHTAFDRKDNSQPASITALAVSKEQRTVYVGDTRGRVFSWSVAEQPGRTMADHWLRDEGAESCVGCRVKFNIYERKHHCRNCGQVFCSKCSRFESEIFKLKILKPVRVCQTCHKSLKQKQEVNITSQTNS